MPHRTPLAPRRPLAVAAGMLLATLTVVHAAAAAEEETETETAPIEETTSVEAPSSPAAESAEPTAQSTASEGTRAAGGGKVSVELANAAPPKAFFGAKAKSTLNLKLRGSGTRDLRIDVIRLGAGVSQTLQRKAVPTGRLVSVRWWGMSSRKHPAKGGRYGFRIRNLVTGEQADLRGAQGKRSFSFYPFIFPVRGPHQYWDGMGAGRGHQGVDVGAACGTRLVAPRGGRVQYRGYQGAAGHYLVVDLQNTMMDAVFMHLRGPARVASGAKVQTGQLLGRVGQTGNASGCHLHFELWGAPGWYEGGRPLNPMKRLRHWDSWS